MVCHPTLGGLIFFGDFINIMDELPDFFLDYREKLSSETRWSDRVCSGDGDWIIDRLTSDDKKPFVINKKLLREDDTMIHKSIREALANSLIHADYHGRQGIVIEKDFRKLRFSNPGTFRISVADAIAGGISDARNSRIFNMFSLIKVGERSGMGLCDLFSIWKDNGFEELVIEEKIEPDRITLSMEIECVNTKDSSGTKDGTKNKGNDRIDTKNGTKDDTKLSENEEAVYACIRLNSDITTKAISADLGISLRTVQRCLTVLKDNGFIIREGSKTRGKWIILK